LVTVAKNCAAGKYITTASERVKQLSLPGVIYKRRNAVFTQNHWQAGLSSYLFLIPYGCATRVALKWL
jgi:hypothetical protein